MFVKDRRIESKLISLKKPNYSFPANLKYKPRGLIAAKSIVYRTIGKKILVVSLRYKMSKLQ